MVQIYYFFVIYQPFASLFVAITLLYDKQTKKEDVLDILFLLFNPLTRAPHRRPS